MFRCLDGPGFVYPFISWWTLGLLAVVNAAATPTVSLPKEVPGFGGRMGEEGQAAGNIVPDTGGRWPSAHSVSSLPYQGSAGATIPLKLAHGCLATGCVVVSLLWDSGRLSGCLHLSPA